MIAPSPRRSAAPVAVFLSLAVAALLGLHGTAHGLDPNEQYEEVLVHWALGVAGLQRDLEPQGKLIERIEIAREDVIADSDPWPNFVNWFHVKTRDHIVRQEVLLSPGETYDPARAAESERNLRSLHILGIARVVPCRSKEPGKVVLLVVTKDLWSIRLNMLYSQTGPLVTRFSLTPTEENFLGRNKRLSLHFDVSWLELHSSLPFPLTLFTTGKVVRDRIVLGQSYVDRRLAGTRLRLTEQFDLYLDGKVPCGGSMGDDRNPDPQMWCPTKEAGSVSGVFARLRLDRPLFSLAAKWGFHIDGWVDIRPIRSFRQNPSDPSSSLRPPGERPNVSLEAVVYQDHTDGVTRNVPNVYHWQSVNTSMGFTRSFGQALKHDVSFGMLAYQRRASEPDDFAYDQQTRDWFIYSVLPRSESAAAVFLGYAIRPTRYAILRNVRSFAFSEDFALGPQLDFEVSFAQDLVSAFRVFVVMNVDAQYRLAIGRHLLTAFASGHTRFQPELGAAPEVAVQPTSSWVDNRLEVGLHHITPPVWIGRFQLYSALVLRKDDLDRGFSRMGGAGTSYSAALGWNNDEAALRGYLSGQFLGRNLWRLHAEYRTRPLNLWTVHLGGVLFYDGGSAWGRPGPGRTDLPFDYHHSVGIGLRGLLPQFDREGLRIDFGFPLDPASAGSFDTWFAFSFGQTF